MAENSDEKKFSYILTREHNAYDQYGEYFVAWFSKAPTVAELLKILTSETSFLEEDERKDLACHILTGGGRRKWEEEWYFLRRVFDGEPFKEKS